MITKFIFGNNAGSQLASPVLIGDTVIHLAAGTGSLFPSPTAGQYFALTFADAGTGLIREVSYCTARSGDALTVTRAQEGTTAKAWAMFDPVANLWTAGQADVMAQNPSDKLGGVSAVQVYAGNPNGHVAGNAGVAATSAPSTVWDISNKIIWVCSVTGNAASAVWIIPNYQQGIVYCGTATGTANAIILTPTIPALAYSDGDAYSFIVHLTNTGAVTVNVSGLGPVNLYKEGPTGPIPLTGGELAAGNQVSMRFDGTRMQLTATELGTAALANASSATGLVAAVTGPISAGHTVLFSDNIGTIKDGGAPILPQGNYINASGPQAPGNYLVDTTAGPITITMEGTATDGDAYSFTDPFGTWAANNMILNPNGFTIQGSTANFNGDVNFSVSVLFIYNSGNWSLQ